MCAMLGPEPAADGHAAPSSRPAVDPALLERVCRVNERLLAPPEPAAGEGEGEGEGGGEAAKLKADKAEEEAPQLLLFSPSTRPNYDKIMSARG